MQKFFQPQSVAIIGASQNKDKIGHILVDNLLRQKKKIKIFPVNPKHRRIDGLQCFPSVLGIAEPVDLAVIAVPAPLVNQIVQECAWREKPIKNIIIISAGFGESGKEGRERKEELRKLITEYDLHVLGPNCLGVANPPQEINLTFAKKNIPTGKIALISQSGALITSLIDLAEENNFGFSLVASLGNKIDLNENDLLQYFRQDKNTSAIVLYLESIADGKRFAKELAKTRAIKPVIVIKAGQNKKSQAAIRSHTGSLAGENAVVAEVIKENGGIIIDNIRDTLILIRLLNSFLPLATDKVVIVTNAGGPGVITTDLLEKHNLPLLELEEGIIKKLRKILPAESSVSNPIDLLGDALADRYQKTLKIVKSASGLGGVIVLVTPQAQTPIEEISRVIIEISRKSKIPIFPVVIGGKASQRAKRIFQRAGRDCFTFPLNLIQNLALLNKNKLGALGDRRKKNSVTTPSQTGGQLLSYKKSVALAQSFGFNIIPAQEIKDKKELKQLNQTINFPVVLKVDSPKIIHKNKEGAVLTGIASPAKLISAWQKLQEKFPGQTIIVQPQVKKGLEIILGMKRDVQFGPVIIIGLGGINTEIFNEKIILVNDFSSKKILQKLQNSKLALILQKEKIDLEKIVVEAEKLARLAQEREDVIAVDINPIFFYPQEPATIVDFKIFLQNNN